MDAASAGGDQDDRPADADAGPAPASAPAPGGGAPAGSGAGGTAAADLASSAGGTAAADEGSGSGAGGTAAAAEGSGAGAVANSDGASDAFVADPSIGIAADVARGRGDSDETGRCSEDGDEVVHAGDDASHTTEDVASSDDDNSRVVHHSGDAVSEAAAVPDAGAGTGDAGAGAGAAVPGRNRRPKSQAAARPAGGKPGKTASRPARQNRVSSDAKPKQNRNESSRPRRLTEADGAHHDQLEARPRSRTRDRGAGAAGIRSGDAGDATADAARLPPTDSSEETRQARAPWHFKVLLVGTVVYLGWRLYQGIGWLVHHV